MTIIVTGAAGFIGYHVAEALLARGKDVMGIDNLNDYYDVRLKEARL
ncbi:MAG: NAD-dependent epimerase/dehydratase family protein, partial [Acetobacteraceae bacterium]|nr:NAD-dependent epimerase/dehydratase family protein [Acetobacteraceae bacterium]MBV8591959.1 NAD-dependent epimerase/dehydratase family protein [Acetobacteraceae bacterium]